MKTSILVAGLVATFAAPALAGPSVRVDVRQARQDARIDAGVASGRLNPREAARLDAQQSRIDRAEDRLAADGRLSRNDRLRLEARQDRASRDIYRARHNRR